MRWTRPRRGAEPIWLEDPVRGDAWLVLPDLPGQPATMPYETDKYAGLSIRLAQAEPTGDGMLAFTRQYGLLNDLQIHDGRRAGSLADWLHFREDVRFLVAAWFADAPDIPHDPALRAMFADVPMPRPREPMLTILNRELVINTRFELRLEGFWPVGPTLHGQILGELSARVATARSFALCARCGGPFVFERATAIYCSDSCRVMTIRARRAA